MFFIKPLKQIIYAIKNPDDNDFTNKHDESEDNLEDNENRDMDKEERQADEL